ncbi:MAG: c-type cytochrome [Gammaproteobacteria bacterium]|nr:c-type cytochrome [Gammaproteobacteria bacterium]
MTTQRASGLFLIAGAALLGLGVTSSALAADVNKLVADCANCHGKDGASTDKDMPIIGGNSVAYITSTFANYKNKDRPCPPAKYLEGPNKGVTSDMCKIAKEFSDSEVKQIAEYFAAKPFVRAKGQTFDAALAKKGEALHEKFCKKCHADGGSLASDDSGMLAGQWTPVIRQQLKEFSEGTRPMEKKMKSKYEKLEAADLEALINYYASFK